MRKNKFKQTVSRSLQGLFLILMIVFTTGCVEEWIYDSDTKRIHKYQVRSRDEQLQGWWKEKKEYPLYTFYNAITGKATTFHPEHNSCSNSYWYTQDSILYETWRSIGTSEGDVYYRFKGNDTLETSRSQTQFYKRDDPNLEWWTWIRVKDQVMLDSLRQYEN